RVLGPARAVRGERSNPIASGLVREIARADVVHCHQTHVLASSLAALAGRLLRRRVFTTDLGGGGWDVSAYVSTDRWFHGHLHLSRYSRRVAGHDGWPRAHVISGGVDTDRFRPCEPRPDGAGACGRGEAVLFAGRILPHKGLDDLVDALPPDLPLEIAGPAPDAGYLAQLRARAAGRRVRFLGVLPDEALVAAYRRALCVVLPSVHRDREGRDTRVPELLGQVLLESLACGTPVIATAVASLPEIVDDGVTGFLVPPNDPAALRDRLERYRADRALVERMGAAGRAAMLERFRWDDVVERCLEIYRR
ncbi:MAG TPA: glycosyltransferase family 4 protein, partial [Vicinamibacterales bacterium]|nr:glycosyltransferase family 4 protein [Vicinamibacterales bacterium]